jgi:hypothetical protein
LKQTSTAAVVILALIALVVISWALVAAIIYLIWTLT